MTATGNTYLVRLFAWTTLAFLAIYLINNYLTYWVGLPGAKAVFTQEAPGVVAYLQLALYPLLFAIIAGALLKLGDGTLRGESKRIAEINTFIIRAAFFGVVYVGLVDAAISFMRVQDLLEPAFGEAMALELGKSQFRGPYVHMPLIALGILTACFIRTLGFTWLALLVVVAELLIVFTRFIFSYEQAFMADLVRFWYAALFLFASAYTLMEEGHVRVDVFYSAFPTKKKGKVNAIGSVVLGMTLCWCILFFGMDGAASSINAPMLNYETTQTGFGMYVKYLMAGFLGIFATSMMIQFSSYLLDAVADIRGEPGGRSHDSTAAH